MFCCPGIIEGLVIGIVSIILLLWTSRDGGETG